MPTESEDELFSAEDAPVVSRLLRDGASWRRHLPPTETLRQQVRALTGIEAEHSARRDELMSESSEPPTPAHQPPATVTTPGLRPFNPPLPRAHDHGQGRGLLAGSAVLVLVVLFVALFAAQAGRGRTPTGSGVGGAGHATPTPATPNPNGPQAGKLVHVAGMDSAAVPVLAPSDPTVAYVASGAKPITRISNGKRAGLPLPDALKNGQFNWLDLSISPLNSDTVFATASLLGSNGNYLSPCPVSQPYALTVPTTGGNLLASPAGGSIPCQAQFVTTDGGQHWQILHNPNNLFLGNSSGMFSSGSFSNPPIVVGKSQLFDVATDGPLASGGTQLLVTSIDGGRSWQNAGAPISGSGTVCSLAAPVGSKTFYVITASQGCASAYAANGQGQTLWRGTSSGGTWTQLSLPTSDYPEAIAVSNTGNRIYVLTGTAQSHTTPLTSTQNIFVSTDGGAHWSVSPKGGVPAGANWVGTATEGISPQPVVRADGALVVPLSANGSTALYEWAPNAKVWQEIAALPNNAQAIASDMLTTTPSGQWVLYLVLSRFDGTSAAYSVYSVAL